MSTQGSVRASCWSITINNPTDQETTCLVPGWKLEGQFEVGKEGTRHFQGMLITPQVRFTQVKRNFPRAHIEVAKSKKALEVYVHKPETRVQEFTPGPAVPNMFQAQDLIAGDWKETEWKELERLEFMKDKGIPLDDLALVYLDKLVSRRIINGQRGLEFIAINPMWRSSWKRFWRSIIARNAQAVQDAQKVQEDCKQESDSSPGDESWRGSSDQEGDQGAS